MHNLSALQAVEPASTGKAMVELWGVQVKRTGIPDKKKIGEHANNAVRLQDYVIKN